MSQAPSPPSLPLCILRLHFIYFLNNVASHFVHRAVYVFSAIILFFNSNLQTGCVCHPPPHGPSTTSLRANKTTIDKRQRTRNWKQVIYFCLFVSHKNPPSPSPFTKGKNVRAGQKKKTQTNLQIMPTFFDKRR